MRTAILFFVFRIMFFQEARPHWSGASNKLCILFPREENIFLSLQSCKIAEGSNSRTSSRTPRERAVSLLRVVQNVLQNSNEDSPMQQGVVATDTAPQNSNSAGLNDDSNRQGHIMQNFRSLFAGYSASSRNQSLLTRPSPAKRPKSGSYVPKETCTHEFFSLADRAAESAPSRSGV